MKFFFTIAFAFLLNTFECQNPYAVVKEVMKIHQAFVLIDRVATDLTKNLNLNPISYPHTHISRRTLSNVDIPMLELPTFEIPTTDYPKKLIKPVVKFNTEDLSKYQKLLAEIDMEIDNQQKMNYEELFVLPNKNSSSPNSNKFKPNSYQSLMITRDENGFFKIGQ